MAAAAEAGIRFTAVDAETLSLIGFAGDETHAEPRSNFFPLPLSPCPSSIRCYPKKVSANLLFYFYLGPTNIT